MSEETPGGASRDASSFYLYGIVRGRGARSSRVLATELPGVQHVRYRDIEALGRATEFALPGNSGEALHEHQRVVETVMRRVSLLPAPFGLVFRGRRALIHFLEDQYLVMDEALAFVDGHWELRLHIAPQDGEATDSLSDLAMHVYAELRRYSRAAIPLPQQESRLLTAAFLVERSSWIDFVERSDDLANAHRELSFDLTGPWPPYDFVRMTR